MRTTTTRINKPRYFVVKGEFSNGKPAYWNEDYDWVVSVDYATLYTMQEAYDTVEEIEVGEHITMDVVCNISVEPVEVQVTER